MDKKLKKAGGKITMPNDMKERIIKACETAEKNRLTHVDSDDGYTEVVSGTERITSRKRIIRTVGAIAACAVLMAGIGTTGVLLHKQSNKMAGSEIVGETNNPFGDFSTFEYSFDAGDGKYGKYSAETYARLSEFLNKFNWGEPAEKPEGRDIDADVEEPMYDIKWTRGNTPPIECDLHIANDGYVSYQESMMSFETGGQMPLTENSKWYKVDFDAFDRGIKEIIGQEKDITRAERDREKENTVKLGEICVTENWEYLIKTVKLTKDGKGMDVLPEGHYSCDENGNLTCDSSYIIADMEVTNKSFEDRSLYMNSTRIDLYNYNAEELDFKTSMEATAYTFNGERSIYAGDFFKTDFKAGETKTFRVGYVIDDEYLDKNYDIIRIEINHSGMSDSNKNIRYYKLGENTNLRAIAHYQAEAPTEEIESAELFYGDHEKLTSTNEESMAKLDAFLKNDFIKMLEPTLSDDIVGGRKYYVEYYFKSDGNKKRRETYYIYMDGFVERRMYVADENGEWQSTGDESYQIDMTKLESVLKDDIGVELPEFAEININKVD